MTRISIIVFTLLIVLPLLFACNREEVRQVSDCGNPACLREDWVVSVLKQKSKPFAKFYEAERGKMPQHIHWIEDTTLPWNTPAYTNISTNTITLKQIPPTSKDDFMVAHELCAFLLLAEGFPTTFPTAKAEEEGVADISSYLNSMLDTPLRDSILKKYGFNAEKAYGFYLGDSLKSASAVGDLAMKTRRLFFYVQMVLYWQDVLNKSEKSEFQLTWDKWYPEVAHDGLIMLSKVRQIGYNTPEKMELLYEDIITTWGLNEMIGLMTKQTSTQQGELSD